jgi:hypothetical protein
MSINIHLCAVLFCLFRPSESTSISPVFMSSLGNSTRKITRKALRQALVGKAYLSASTNVSSQKKCRSKFKKMLTQHSVTPKALKSVSLSVSSKKRSYRLARKDQGLHKLVFDRGGLPEGTELGYYARGQVTNYLILCVVIWLYPSSPGLLF